MPLVAFVLSGIYFGWQMLITSVHDPIGITQAIISKNKKYLAYGFFNSGGGGPGWCQFNVNIYDITSKKGNSNRFLNSEDTVFHIDSCLEGFNIQWLESDNPILKIRCPVLDYDVRKRKLEKFKDVTILYQGC